MDFSELARASEMDQARAAVKQMAHLLWIVHTEAMKAGFTEEQAFQMTRDFQRNMQMASRPNHGQDGKA